MASPNDSQPMCKNDIHITIIFYNLYTSILSYPVNEKFDEPQNWHQDLLLPANEASLQPFKAYVLAPRISGMGVPHGEPG